MLKFKNEKFRRRMVQIINTSLLEQHKLDEAVALAKEVCQSDIDQASWELFQHFNIKYYFRMIIFPC